MVGKGTTTYLHTKFSGACLFVLHVVWICRIYEGIEIDGSLWNSLYLY